MQTVWVVVHGRVGGGNGEMQAFSTEEKARGAIGPTNPGSIRQLSVDKPIKRSTWVVRDNLSTDPVVAEFPTKAEAMRHLSRFEVVEQNL